MSSLSKRRALRARQKEFEALNQPYSGFAIPRAVANGDTPPLNRKLRRALRRVIGKVARGPQSK